MILGGSVALVGPPMANRSWLRSQTKQFSKMSEWSHIEDREVAQCGAAGTPPWTRARPGVGGRALAHEAGLGLNQRRGFNLLWARHLQREP